ncbi:MAG TPA: glutaredoxin family protein [Ktedonobacterales bacterium]|nr:glutaredoxin family protein [Ktedonobacterales bacterium]
MEQADLLPKPHQVVFYTKAGCHLCDEARDLLEELAEEITFELTETDIRTDMTLFEAYRYRIPVIIIDEHAAVEGRISLSELRRAFSSRQERR